LPRGSDFVYHKLRGPGWFGLPQSQIAASRAKGDDDEDHCFDKNPTISIVNAAEEILGK